MTADTTTIFNMMQKETTKLGLNQPSKLDETDPDGS